MNDAFPAHLLRFPAHLVIDQSNLFKGVRDRQFRIAHEQSLNFSSTEALAPQRTQPC